VEFLEKGSEESWTRQLDVLLPGTVGFNDVRDSTDLRRSWVTVKGKAVAGLVSVTKGRNAAKPEHREVPVGGIRLNDCTNRFKCRQVLIVRSLKMQVLLHVTDSVVYGAHKRYFPARSDVVD